MTISFNSHRRHRLTKIVATLGPVSSSPAAIRQLFEAGVDVFRLNFSHGTHEDHAARFAAIRQVEKETGRPICIMADLQGPKLRIGTFERGAIDLTTGQKFRLDRAGKPGDNTRVDLPHPEIFAALKPDTELLLDDGRICLQVKKCGPDFADAIVKRGTRLSDRKGVNVPHVILPLSPLTPKDQEDLKYALELGVDWVALSFVQKPEDMVEARKLIGNKAFLLAKIEKPSAITNLPDITKLSDGLMVARGDMGVEMPAEDVPSLQKHILAEAHKHGKPAIVATQMLESMISSPTPTRAEASDVATAVYDGADAVMLSAETATGQYPIEAVSIMDRVAKKTENDPIYQTLRDAQRLVPPNTPPDAITAAARQVAQIISAACIVTYTMSGSTTLRAARERPNVPILGLTPSLETARRMAMVFGVHSVQTQNAGTFSEIVQDASRIAHQHDFAKIGQRIVITAGVPFGTPGSTNSLRIAVVEEKQVK